MKNFKDKTVVITGAGSGMGRAYAIEFSKLGARLALNDYDTVGLAETCKIARDAGAKKIYSKVFDVSDKQAMYDFADGVKINIGNAHVIINNAGIEGGNKSGVALDNTDFERVMAINFFGVLYGTKAFLPQLIDNNEGAVVNVSSVFGLIGSPNSSDYCAAKFAVRGFTESLMTEFQDSPINIHCVHPGGIATNISAAKDSNLEFAQKYLTTPPEKIVKHVIRSIGWNSPKIVYGNQSQRIWLASLAVPTKLLNWILWREVKQVVDTDHYQYLPKSPNYQKK